MQEGATWMIFFIYIDETLMLSTLYDKACKVVCILRFFIFNKVSVSVFKIALGTFFFFFKKKSCAQINK